MNPAAKVLRRIERVLDVEAFGGLRHELHQAHRSLATDRFRVVAGLDNNQGVDQFGVDAVFRTDLVDHLPQFSAVRQRGRALPRRGGTVGAGLRRHQHDAETADKRYESTHATIMTAEAQKEPFLSAGPPKIEHLQRCIDLMTRSGAPAPAVASFTFHFNRVAGGEREYLSEDDIEPIEFLPDSEQFGAFRNVGEKALHRVAVIKLNGGLGTGMGLKTAKSLLQVRDGLTFLDLITRQILAVRSGSGAKIPLILMNSSHTADASQSVLSRYPDLALPDLPGSFLQNRIPKILASDMSPAGNPGEDQAWCPPGHGDLYTAIAGSGLLAELLSRGFEYAFVSNADNLGAVLDPDILGFMTENGYDFVMEAADRSAADRKGGHLCRLTDDRLALRESAQCRPADEEVFQNVARHRFFNTNNLWLRLPALASALETSGGFLPLDTIVNRKLLDPRDPSSQPVLQLETAMGAAISHFEKAAAIRVPRRRFSPVKNTDDLLAVRSDAYRLTDDWLVVLDPKREVPPVIDLDHQFFKMIDDFERRFPAGPPSLQDCDSLRVEGDITFGRGVAIEGETALRTDRPHRVPDGTRLRGTVGF